MAKSVKGKDKKFTVLYGENMTISMLEKVMEIDEDVYGELGMAGTLENMRKRFLRNKRTFVCLMDGETLAGYINFFPISDRLFDQILGPVEKPDIIEGEGFDPDSYFKEITSKKKNPEDAAKDREKLIIDHYINNQGRPESGMPSYSDVIDFYNQFPDDDIPTEDINPDYSTKKEENNLFIISVAIKKEYRSKSASTQLTDAFIGYLNELAGQGTPVNSVSGICVSEGGEKFLRGLNFCFHREIGTEKSEYIVDDQIEYSKLIAETDELGCNWPKTKNHNEDEAECHDRVYLCWGYYLDRLLEGRMYHKTHKDDIYLFVPFAENPENSKIDELIGEFKKWQEENATGEKETDEFDDDPDEKFFYRGVIPGSVDDPVKKKKTKKLLNDLRYFMEYEYDGFIKKELTRIYLGECLFRHTTDRYADDDAKKENETAVGETMGEEKADLLLLSYKSANMFVLVIYLPDCKYSSSMVGDQLSKMKLQMRSSVDEFGIYHYKDITEYIEEKYNLVVCGSGKAFYCMNRLPSNGRWTGANGEEDKDDEKCDNQELMNILTGETYFSVHQDFYIKKYKKLKKQLGNDLAIYDYYKAFMSPVSIVMVLDTFEETDEETGKSVVNESQKIEDAATYVFIVELVILQNTALTKLSLKVGKALEHEGDVPYEYISHLYKDYGRTLKLWDSDNFKYYGTQMEAEQIRKALGNDELREKYEKEQEFLENIVEVNSANDERRNGWILGIVGTLLAILQVAEYVKDFFALVLGKIALLTNNPGSIFKISEEAEQGGELLAQEVAEEAAKASVTMFDTILWGGIIIAILIWWINGKRKRYEQKLNFHNETESGDREG